MRPQHLLLIVLLGCTKQNPAACCIDDADCKAAGLEHMATCDTGELCRGHQCIAETCANSSNCDATAKYCSNQRCEQTCTDDAQCPGFSDGADLRYCVNGACAACRIGQNDCPSSNPICDMGTCRHCAVDDECSSAVCDIDQGTCTPAETIRYAMPGGSTSSECTQSSPCAVARALAIVDSTHPIVRMLPGTYTDGNLTASVTTTVVATGASIGNSAITGAQGATLSVRGLSASTFECGTAGGMVLRRVTMTGGGVAAQCDFTARESTFVAMYIGGSVGPASATIDRCQFNMLTLNAQPGKAITVTLTDSIINSLTLSGLDATAPTMIDAEYNTFYSQGAPPVQCGADGTTPSGITFRNNIITYTAGPNSASSGTSKCIFDTNLIFPQSVALGTNTIRMDPQFVDEAAGDLHLKPNSPAIDASKTTALMPSTDYDGTLRPQGGARDIGAFEYH